MVEEGKTAPDFELTSDTGDRVKLSDLRGKPVVLYFYPKDDTPGCTVQARDPRCVLRVPEARCRRPRISPDDEASHVKFRDKYEPVHAARGSDPRGRRGLRVWVEKNAYGQKKMGIERSTFIIDAGNVTRVMRRVKPDTHADDVLAALPS